MAALVVVSVPRTNGHGGADARVGIFPGGATPSVRSADTAFWIGYGFAPELGDAAGAVQELGEDTRFELDVDGRRVEMRTDVQIEGTARLRKTDLAEFPAGLPAGWHEFVGRWYDGGKLILSSRASIQFVER
ncbi:MAG: hypothetical protein OEW52_01645 [Thermoleophilia bacterium]|nr:hypothetical protein [Thermoleophilia bacterium]MDH4340176.1 hypothetical protein [Thermoleophilia bacterium]MDH5279832.1 hypothetical protein [Thermoleophilia bacterium]